jgi:hypothetical protein
MPRKLAALQRQMFAAITAVAAPSSAGYIAPNSRQTAAERLGVYHGQYWLRLTRILSDDFPRLRRRMGDEAFDAMAKAYLTAYPSKTFSLARLGDDLPRFLSDQKYARQFAETAALELAIIRAAEAPDAPALDRDTVTDDSRVGLHPGLTLIPITHAVDTGNPQRLKQKAVLAVYRDSGTIYHERLPWDAYGVLNALKGGKRLAEAFRGIDWDDQTISRNFKDWYSKGWLTDPN